MYKVVIGLEVHCELKTNSKNFSTSKNDYSSLPNTNVSVVDLGMPGILPVINKEAVKKSLMVAMALHCETPKYLMFDRKNYFYPDLPKGYQITQSKYPVGINGYLMINVDGVDKKILIHDTHLEEDTASLDHFSNYSLIDYNRCGVPLLETVTEPVLSSGKEAIAFLEALRSMFLYCGVSNARSDKGQIRCDVNVSLMKKNDTELGTKVEMKNINSFQNVKDAIECEIARQTELLDKGEKIVQETRRYDSASMKTYAMRSKVDAIDYKYFTEPNIPKIEITNSFLEEIKKDIPELQHERINKYINDYEISRVDSNTIAKDREISDYFEEAIKYGSNPKSISNWLISSIMGYLNKEEKNIKDIYLTPKMLVDLIKIIEEGKISSKQGKEVLTRTLEEDKDPLQVVKELNISQITDIEEIRNIVLEIINENISLVDDYRNGKRVFDYFIGQIMKKTKGRANPTFTSQILKEELDKKL